MTKTVELLLPFIAGLITAAWAFYQFYYQEKKSEKERTGHLILKTTMKKVGTKDHFTVVRFKLEINNKSRTKMYVLADYINLFGISMKGKEQSDESYLKMSVKKINEKKYAYLHRFVQLKDKKIVFSGKIFDYDDYWWLEPQEKLEISRMAYIPEDFDYAELVATVYYSNDKDWLEVQTVPLPEEKGLCHEVLVTKGKQSGERFNWHDPAHLRWHRKYRNAEVSSSTLLFIEPGQDTAE